MDISLAKTGLCPIKNRFDGTTRQEIISSLVKINCREEISQTHFLSTLYMPIKFPSLPSVFSQPFLLTDERDVFPK